MLKTTWFESTLYRSCHLPELLCQLEPLWHPVLLAPCKFTIRYHSDCYIFKMHQNQEGLIRNRTYRVSCWHCEGVGSDLVFGGTTASATQPEQHSLKGQGRYVDKMYDHPSYFKQTTNFCILLRDNTPCIQSRSGHTERFSPYIFTKKMWSFSFFDFTHRQFTNHTE